MIRSSDSKGLGVTVFRAEARFTSPDEVRAGEAEIRPAALSSPPARRPAVPPIPGLDGVPYFTNETDLRQPRAAAASDRDRRRRRSGSRLAQAHRLLGARGHRARSRPAAAARRSRAGRAPARSGWRREGIALRPQVADRRRRRATARASSLQLWPSGTRIAGSHLLVAAGRRPSIDALDLAAAGIAANRARRSPSTRGCAPPTAASFAIGDAAGGPQFTHVALYHAGIVIRNALFRLPARVDYRALPWVTYTDPELAQVGLTEAAARERTAR